VIFTGCNFWKSPFYCRYNARFFVNSQESNILENIFLYTLLVIFAKSCLLEVHNAESDRGQKEIW